MAALAMEELNVKKVVSLGDSEDLTWLYAKPRFGALGPKHGARTPAVAAGIADLDAVALRSLRDGEPLDIEIGGERVRVTPEDLVIQEETLTDLAVATGGGYLAALDTDIDDALRAEGYAREIVNRVQRLRRDAGLEVADRIRLGVAGPQDLERAVSAHADYVAGETLAVEVQTGSVPPGGLSTAVVKIDDVEVRIGIDGVDERA
jgi:isoleucyl-tRNA synthetase